MSTNEAEPFYICSSDITPPPGSQHLTISEGETYGLLGYLDNKQIKLSSVPKLDSPTAHLDNSDSLREWLQARNATEVQLTLLTDQGKTAFKDIRTFDISLKGFREHDKADETDNWIMQFSSSTEALTLAFGRPPASGDTPGIAENTIYCGLTSFNTKTKITIGSAYKSAGISNPGKTLSSMEGMELVIPDTSVAKHRNALWVNPSYGLDTTLRLQFKIGEDCGILKKEIQKYVKNIDFSEVHIIWKKSIGRIWHEGDRIPSARGYFALYIPEFTVYPSENETNKDLAAALEFSQDTFSLTLFTKPHSAKAQDSSLVSAVVRWISSFTQPWFNPEVLLDALSPDKVFDKGALELRRVRLSVRHRDEEGNTALQLSDLIMDVEIPAKFGASKGGPVPVFLLSYSWNERLGPGQITGSLWKPRAPWVYFDPYFEEWSNLEPLTKPTAIAIDLTKIAPEGGDIQNIPEFIPTKITNVSVTVSADGIYLSALFARNPIPEEDSSVPQPLGSELGLEFKFFWKPERMVDLRIAVQMALPCVGSDHLPAMVSGYVQYNFVGSTWEMVDIEQE